MNELEDYLTQGTPFRKKASLNDQIMESPAIQQAVMTTPAPQAVVNPATKQGELEMWKQWKDSGHNPKYLRPLNDSMKNLVFSHVNKWKSVNIPTRLIQAEAEKHMIEAFKSYDPKMGASLSTHVSQRLYRIERFVTTHQNVGRVVESRAGKTFGEFKTARNLFVEESGREPTPQELAEKMTLEYKRSVSVNDAKAFMKEDRRDLSTSDESDFTFEAPSNRMLLMMLPAELTPEENQVYERLFGLNGSAKLDKGAIARQLRIHPSKVSRIIASIRTKLEKYQ